MAEREIRRQQSAILRMNDRPDATVPRRGPVSAAIGVALTTRSRELLIRVAGFPATLVHHDTAVWDRWRWLSARLPKISQGSKAVLDVGCGSGAFTIGLALRGYDAVGLTWDPRDRAVAERRAELCGAETVRFELQDARSLDQRVDLQGQFDAVICCEVIEHILNDAKLVQDMARCLKPGGVILLTTPFARANPISAEDLGPLSSVEDGGHVRRGYVREDLEQLFTQAGLAVSEVSYCTGLLSQKITMLMRSIGRVNPIVGWALIAPLRILPPLLDGALSQLTGYPNYCIAVAAIAPEGLAA